jgi:hypothetical protein
VDEAAKAGIDIKVCGPARPLWGPPARLCALPAVSQGAGRLAAAAAAAAAAPPTHRPPRHELQVELAPGTKDGEYLSRLGAALEQAAASGFAPDLLIYNAGGCACMEALLLRRCSAQVLQCHSAAGGWTTPARRGQGRCDAAGARPGALAEPPGASGAAAAPAPAAARAPIPASLTSGAPLRLLLTPCHTPHAMPPAQAPTLMRRIHWAGWASAQRASGPGTRWCGRSPPSGCRYAPVACHLQCCRRAAATGVQQRPGGAEPPPPAHTRRCPSSCC